MPAAVSSGAATSAAASAGMKVHPAVPTPSSLSRSSWHVADIIPTSPAYEPPMRPARSSAVSSGPSSIEKMYPSANAKSFFFAASSLAPITFSVSCRIIGSIGLPSRYFSRNVATILTTSTRCSMSASSIESAAPVAPNAQTISGSEYAK